MKEAKKLVPQLRFPEFRNMADWQDRRIGEFLTESRLPGSKGNVAKKLTVKLWGNGVFGKNESIQGSINTQYFRRKAGQFIYSKLDFLNQAFGVIPPDLDGFESTVDLPCFDVADELNPVFLLEYVKRKDFYERLGETADGSRKARRIHAETFQSFSLARPTPAEQQKIAECLSSLDELIAAQARKVDALKTHKKGLMQQLFPREGETQPRLRFPEFRDAEEWTQKALGDIADVLMCKRIFANETNPTEGVPFYKIGTLGGTPDAFISQDIFSDYKQRYNYPRLGEVLITCSGTIGKCLPFNGSDSYFQDSNIVWIDNSTLIVTNQFLLSILSSVDWSGLNSTTITRIYGPDLRGLVIKFPQDHLEQQRIANCLTALDDVITSAIQELATLKTHKKGLMQQLFPSAAELAA